MKSRARCESISYRRCWHTHARRLGARAVATLAVAPAAAIVLAVAPAGASARAERIIAVPARAAGATRPSDNAGADLGALGAYRTYLSALSTQESVSAARDSAVVQTVASTCSGALDDLSGLSSGQLKRSALTDFADEVDGDLDLAYTAPSRTALARFGSALSGLSWSTAAATATTTALVAAERTMLGIAPSDLCADADTLDAAPLNEPTATVRFLRRYRAAANRLHNALSAFQALLTRYEVVAERSLVAQIDQLVTQFSSQSAEAEQNASTMTLSDLGASSS